VLAGEVRSDEVAAGRQRVDQGLDDLRGVLVVHDEMQHGHEHERDRLAEVQDVRCRLVREDRLGVAQVRVDVRSAAFRRTGEQCPRVRKDQRIVIRVDDPGLRGHRLRDLMDIVRGGQARADVEKLPDPGLTGQESHRARHERAILPRERASRRHAGQDFLRGLAVRGEVVFSVEVIIVHTGRMGP
jgi:hypothetical protein